MVNRDLLSVKLGELADRIARVKEHSKPSAAALAASRDSTDLVSFNLMLAVQACTDIASHIIADEEWSAAGTLGESFTRLEQHGVIGSETANSLRAAVGLRNVVAHGYSGVDIESLQRAATTGLSDLDRFAREVAAWASHH